MKAGDPDGAFARAHRVMKQRMVSQRLAGITHGAAGGPGRARSPDRRHRGVGHPPGPPRLRNDIATALGLAQSMVRVIAPEVGGGFGVKFGLYPEDATLAVIAHRHRIPVRWTETRNEHMTSTTHGRAQVTDLEAAVERDGTITALRMRVTADLGAYPVFTFIPELTLFMGIGVYHVKNIDLKATCVFTNSTSVAAYRGAGRPEAAYYLERFVDIIAAELGLAPEVGAPQELHPALRLPVRGAHRPELRQRRVRPRAHQGAGRRAAWRSCATSRSSGWSAAIASCSASAWPATWRCAASGRSRARWCGWSRGAT